MIKSLCISNFYNLPYNNRLKTSKSFFIWIILLFTEFKSSITCDLLNSEVHSIPTVQQRCFQLSPFFKNEKKNKIVFGYTVEILETLKPLVVSNSDNLNTYRGAIMLPTIFYLYVKGPCASFFNFPRFYKIWKLNFVF